MKKFWTAVKYYIKKSDMLILALSIMCTIFGTILIKSATKGGSYVTVQIVAMVLGIFIFVLFSVIDVDLIADRSVILYILSLLFICTLFIWGESGDSGNRAWIRFGIIGIQPAEVVKIPFIIIFARLMLYLQDRIGINRPLSIIVMLLVFGIMFGLIIVSSADLGSALVYFFVLIVMLFSGGLSLWWFLAGFAVLGACAPFIWKNFLGQTQKDRIMAPYFKSVDPSGLGIRWQANQSKLAISGGGFTGTGLGQGEMTQAGSVPQQHTDFIFSAAGEELGFVGCLAIVVLLLALIIRCFYVAVKCNNQMGYLVCCGVGAMFIAQMLENIGMCLGLTPVIGLTLPFFSYGGSSILTNFMALGIVSGVKMRARTQRLGRY